MRQQVFIIISNLRLRLWFILLIIIAIFSCTDKYKDFNRSPDQATKSDVDKDGLSVGGFMPGMLQNILPASSANDYQRAQNLTGDIFSGYMAAIGNWNGSNNNTTYNLNFADWNQVGFNVAYSSVMTPWLQIKNRGDVAEDIFAVLQIIKIGCMHRIADNYGPIPYSKFGSGELTTPYDSQESVYMAFFDELTKAIQVLENFVKKSPGATPLKDYDLIYDGDYIKWIKYANSLKLRLAIRIVYVNPQKAKQFAEEAVNGITGVITDNQDNVLLKSGKGITVYNPMKQIVDNFRDTRMGASMDSYLKGYKDPRLSVYFKLSSNNTYFGVRNGITILDKNTYTPASEPNIEENTAISPIQIMVAAETYFLRAEGAVRGWNMGGLSAEELYNKGIETSFAQRGVQSNYKVYVNDATSTSADYTYPTSGTASASSSKPSTITIKWNNGAPEDEKIERILTQKWLAMYPDGQEAWSELRRTGYPKIFKILVNNSGGVINTDGGVRRIPFPPTEYQGGNKSEVDKAIILLGGPDNGGTRVWWDIKIN